MSVRTARSCAGAPRAVTSAVRTRIGTLSRSSACCNRCSASRSGLNGPGGKRTRRVIGLVRLERVEALLAKHALGIVAEQHRVAVEGDAHLAGMRVGAFDAGVDHGRRKAAR